MVAALLADVLFGAGYFHGNANPVCQRVLSSCCSRVCPDDHSQLRAFRHVDLPLGSLFVGGALGRVAGSMLARHPSMCKGASNTALAGLLFALAIYMLYRGSQSLCSEAKLQRLKQATTRLSREAMSTICGIAHAAVHPWLEMK